MHARAADTAFRCRFTLFAVGATRAHAEIVLKQVDASCIVLARMLHRTRFNLLFALFARPAIFTNAFIRSDTVDALSTIQTRFIFAVIDVGLAVGTRESFTTITRKFIVQVQTTFGANRVARINQAFINFGFTLQSNISWTAFADKSIDFIDTSGPILAWLTLAIVNCVLTILSGVARLTVARVSIDQINTAAFICAWIFGTIINIDVTIAASPAGIANAFIIEQTVDARTMTTWFRQTQIDLLVTAFAGEARWARATEIID